MTDGAGSVRARLADQARRAAAALPPDVFDYYDGGAGDEIARDEAELAWQRLRLRPRVLRDVSSVDLGVDLLGVRLPHPVLVAPTAWHAPLHADAELAMAGGAAGAAAVMAVSTRASRRLEEIAARAGRWWMQVYVTRDRRLTEHLVGRAVAAGASALVLTADTPFVGRKARQGRLAALGTPGTLANIAAELEPQLDTQALEQDPSITVETIGWLREISGLPVLVKGVLRADDARLCLQAGAAGLIVSNHGGRQLGRAVSTAVALREVVEAAQDKPVLVDGGLRSGEDIAVALALGARAVMIGRPLLWALALGGAPGVTACLDMLVDDLSFTMALLGVTSPSGLDPSFVTSAP